ncbi:MAG: NUDIX hydrolase [Candidatus Competibacteraceae bacterium]|jgi:8-oxo-dGTP diphosphatase|nr:NUDIX hydrolase [Candidatus Competibacteraceae bacterium]
MRKTATTTVGAVITTQDNGVEKILLTRRNIQPFKDHWCLPGGHIDADETARHAIVREVKEEVGLDFEPNFFAYFDEIIPEQSIHNVVLIFTGPTTGTVIPQESEVSEIGWFSWPEASALALAFRHQEILSAYAQQGG